MIPRFLCPMVLFFFACRSEPLHFDELLLESVRGSFTSSEINWALTHEHITTDFIGAEKVPQPQYSRDSAIAIIQHHLANLKTSGINTLMECTPNYIGRDIQLLKALAEITGMHILTNTGYYAAVEKKFIPSHAFSESAEQLANRWIAESEKGIDGTEIKPGFIKIGYDAGTLDSLEKKLLKAAILTHKSTGLTIAIHCGNGVPAWESYEIIRSEGLSANTMVWVHAQNATLAENIAMAKNDAWVSLDGVNVNNFQTYLDRVIAFHEHGLLNRLLISHDDGWWVVKDEKTGEIQLDPFKQGAPYLAIPERLLPELLKNGLTDVQIDQLMRLNPGMAFAKRTVRN